LFLPSTLTPPAFGRLHDGLRVGDRALRLPRHALSASMGLLRELRAWDDASPLAIESLCTELITDAAPPRDHWHDNLQRVLDRLEDDSATPPTIGELAGIAGYHTVHLARVFRKRYGLAPSDYLRKRRLHKAVSLIAQRRTLANAAAVLGFVDESHLHRSFVAEFGMTPGAFRRLALGRAEVARIQDARLRRC
jgi:AraC family transcriptional regulator